MSGRKNQTGPETPSIRDAAAVLLAMLDVPSVKVGVVPLADAAINTDGRDPHPFTSAVEALRSAVQNGRSAQLPVQNLQTTMEGIDLVKAGQAVEPAHIRAIVEAAEVAVANAHSFDLRWDADMRAIKRWQAGAPHPGIVALILAANALCDATAGHDGSVTQRADVLVALDRLPADTIHAGGRDLIWPDHADLVVWLLDVINTPPLCPSIDAVHSLVGELDQESRHFHMSAVNPNEDQRLPEVRIDPYARAARMLDELAAALVSASRRLLAAETRADQLRGIVHAATAARACGIDPGDPVIDEVRGMAGCTCGAVVVPTCPLHGSDAPLPGEVQCRVCQCTETTACLVAKDGGGLRPCGWAAPGLCDNPDCIEADRVRLEARLNDYLATAPREAGFDLFGVVYDMAPGWEFTTDQNLANTGGVPVVQLIRYAPNEPL